MSNYPINAPHYIGSNMLNVCHFNACSIKAKLGLMQIHFAKQKYHIIGVTETWLKTHHTNKQMELPGYKLLRQDRKGRGGGGVAFYIRKDFLKLNKVKISSRGSTSILDHLTIECIVNSTRLCVGVGYIHHKGLSLDELEFILNDSCLQHDIVIFMGDLNIDLLVDRERFKLESIINNLNMATPQTQPTRIHDSGASLLDLILANIPYSLSDFHQSTGFSDHNLIAARFLIPCRLEDEFFAFRNYNNIDCFNLQQDIDNLNLTEFYSSNDPNVKLDILNTHLLQTLDDHAPIEVKKKIYGKPPWFTVDIQNAIQIRDMAHKAWKINRSHENKTLLRHHDKRVSGKIKGARNAYIRSKLDPHLPTKEIWKNIRDQGLCKDRTDYDHLFCINQLNESFISLGATSSSETTSELHIPHLQPYQINPIAVAGGSNDNNDCPTAQNLYSRFDPHSQFKFQPVSEDNILSAIMSINSGSIGSDGIPIKFIKMSLPALLPALTHLFNEIINTNKFPALWKVSKVIAIPKVPDPQSPSDMRPISILAAMSKTLEILLSDQIKTYIDDYGLLTDFQSGFRKGRSTASLLINVSDFIRQAIDKGNLATLVLLDFSKAFNTVNFGILKLKLVNDYNFSMEASNLVLSYLLDRSQYVERDSVKSLSLPLSSGVPQGSILGPLIFSLYINDIVKCVINSRCHIFADDVQLLYEIQTDQFEQTNLANSLVSTEPIMQDLHRISGWASRNKLSLNIPKTKAIVFGRNNLIKSDNIQPILLQGQVIPFETKVRNLGLIMNHKLDWTDHVNSICQKMYLALKTIWVCQKGTPHATRILLVRSLVLSHLLYCDIVFSNFNNLLMNKITRIHNLCIRYIHGLGYYDHISQYRKLIFGMELRHYLDFRMVSFIYKSLHDPSTPNYIKESFQFSQSVRTKNLIISTHLNTIMDDALMVRGAKLWNRLPIYIRDADSDAQFRSGCLEFYGNA